MQASRALLSLSVVCSFPFSSQVRAAPGGVALELEAASDHREGGLSWSDGKPTVSIAATIPVSYALSFDVKALALRNSTRHGGADVGLSLAPRYTFDSGGWRFGVGAIGHVFAGRSRLNYVEVGVDGAYTIGPARLVGLIDYAPTQNAIGGDNLHVEARALVGIPGTPLTAFGGIGRTWSPSRDDPRASRLRPGGSYNDHHIGVERTHGPLTAGALYSGTSIGADEGNQLSPYFDRHTGSRLVFYLRMTT